MSVEVTQNLTQITISSVGVAGANGTSGTSGVSQNISHLATTASFNSYTSSYLTDSASFDSRITAATNEQDLSNYAITTGSNTFDGDQTISGSLFVSGTTELGGNLVPKTPQGATLGTPERPFKELFLQSGSIIIESDTPGEPAATISNFNGNIDINTAGFSISSGSNTPFTINREGQIVIKNGYIDPTKTSIVQIIGNDEGYFQLPTKPGTTLQCTGFDGVQNRFLIDSYGTNTNSSIILRNASGTAQTPLNTEIGSMGRIGIRGYNDAQGFGVEEETPDAYIGFYSPYGFASGSRPAEIRFFTTPSGSNDSSLVAKLNNNGLEVTGSMTISGSTLHLGNTTHSGSVTLSSGSALNINDGFYVNGNKQFNYGQWVSLQTQTGSANTAYAMKLDTQTDGLSGFYVGNNGSGFPTRIYAQSTGLYNIQFSAQLHTTANEACDFSVWFAMTGSSIQNSNTDFTVEKIAGGGYGVAALNFLTPITSGSYVELYWSKTTANGQLQAKGVQSTPTRPATPSVIVTVTQVA